MFVLECKAAAAAGTFRCFRCQRDWSIDDGAACAGCGQTCLVHGGQLPDFIGPSPAPISRILDWSDDFLELVERTLPIALKAHGLNAAERAALQAEELLDASGKLTALGRSLFYHLSEWRRQQEPHDRATLRRFAAAAQLGRDAQVLDVGGGAGQTMCLLEDYHPAERVVVDLDGPALAFGCRRANYHRHNVRYVRASAHALPFSSGRFTHVLSRVSVNYMHQSSAVREMWRVLRPGGFLFIEFEGPGFDLRCLSRCWHPYAALCRLRDLIYGGILQLADWQMVPGNRITGGRAYTSRRWLKGHLLRNHGEIVFVNTLTRFLGLPAWSEVLARKKPN